MGALDAAGPRWLSRAELRLLSGFPAQHTVCQASGAEARCEQAVRSAYGNAVRPPQMLWVLGPVLATIRHGCPQLGHLDLDSALQALMDAVPGLLVRCVPDVPRRSGARGAVGAA